MRPRYVVRITPDDVGRRVTVRTRIPAGPGEPATTDTVGTLLAWRDGFLQIRRRDGAVRTVAEADLLAARVVEPPPSRPGRGG